MRRIASARARSTRNFDNRHTTDEQNFDFGGNLYAEGNITVFVDAAGPVCLAHAFFATSNSVEMNGNAEQSVLYVDAQDEDNGVGGWQAVGSLGEIFKGEFEADLGAGDVRPGAPGGWGAPVRAPPLTPSTGWGGARVPSLPRPLAFNTERAGDLRSGFTLAAPICAHSRLRIGWYHPRFLDGNASALLQDGSDCVVSKAMCAFAMYTNDQLVSFPGTRLPEDVAAFDARAPAFTAADARALPELVNDVAQVWAPLRLFDAALAGGDAARSRRVCGAVALSGTSSGAAEAAEGEWTVFAERGRPGTISLLWVDFPGAPHLLHSAFVWLEASWDDGRAALRASFEGLIGPTRLEAGGPAMVPKEGRAVGEMPRSGCVVNASASPLDAHSYCSGGFYMLLPMAWQSAARVSIVFAAGAAEAAAGPALQAGTLEAWPPAPWPPSVPWRRALHQGSRAASAVNVDVCSAVVVSRDAAAAAAREGAAATLGGGSGPPKHVGYLQSSRLDTVAPGKPWSMSPDVGTLLSISGVSGSLVYFAFYLRCEIQFCSEGDIRGWADGRRTPTVWSTGFEDFFGGAHAYVYRPNHIEPMYVWDRRSPHNGDSTTGYFQAQTFGLDAPRFQHSFKMALEVQSEIGFYARTTSLFYGLPAGAPNVTSTLRPAALWHLAPAEAHYEVRARGGGAIAAADVDEYELASVVASRGELAIGGELVRERVLALLAPATVSFTVSVLPSARSVVLRRLVDTRRSVAVARLSVDGVFVGRWIATDRSFDQIDTNWQEDDFALPPAATFGKSSLRISLDVAPEAARGNRTYLRHQLSPAWVEARYDVLCFPEFV